MTLNLINNIEINTVMDLYKIKKIMEEEAIEKVNYSELGRELNKDPRTIKKYIHTNTEKLKNKKRNKPSQFDEFKPMILELLDSKIKIFSRKEYLYRYLKDNHNMKGSSSAFRTYILKNPEINDKFRKHNSKSTRTVRFETEYGKQAQVDWKESFQVILKDLSKVEINIFTYLLSNSRYRVNILSLSKSRKVLFDFLDKSFNITGGVPKEILFDNMKTVMDESRTKNSEGKINNEFNQFAKDYGFKPNICMAKRPQTKGKVEATMKVIDQIMVYNGDLDYDGLLKLVQKINDEENIRFYQSYQKIPVKHLEKEKAFLQPLPQESIRKQYKIKTHNLKVDNSSLITYQNNKYSIPYEYIGKIIDVQQIDDMLYMYCSTKLITFHQISKNNINYYEKHYRELLKAKNYRDDKINEMMKNNTCIIGEKNGKNSL